MTDNNGLLIYRLYMQVGGVYKFNFKEKCLKSWHHVLRNKTI